jgi:hypothetical protein
VLCASLADDVVESVTGERVLLTAIAADAVAEQQRAEEQAAADKHLIDTVRSLLQCNTVSTSVMLVASAVEMTSCGSKYVRVLQFRMSTHICASDHSLVNVAC